MIDALERTERQLGILLAVWGGASVAAGLGILAATGDRQVRAFGRQTAGWGAINLGIATVAHLRAKRRDRPLGDDDREKMHRVLLVNTGLDVGYMAVGGALLARADGVADRWSLQRPYPAEELRGDGAAVVVQGAFLLVLDSVFAARTRR